MSNEVQSPAKSEQSWLGKPYAAAKAPVQFIGKHRKKLFWASVGAGVVLGVKVGASLIVGSGS